MTEQLVPRPPEKQALLDRLRPHGQGHVLRFWDELGPAERKELAEQIERIDLAGLDRLFAEPPRQADVRRLAEQAESPPAYAVGRGARGLSAQQAAERGAAVLRAGEVAALVVAGGQGTRLGFDHPKGLFPIGPLSGNTLFQIHVEKVRAVGRRYGVRVPLCVMTSPATHEETVRFFQDHNRFGLAEDDLIIFCQGTMPVVDAEAGKLLLAEKHRLAVSPDGHGGMLRAIADSGTLARLGERGVKRLFYFQVDNPLVQIASPEMIGYHAASGSQMTTQVIAKQDPTEQVGNVAAVDGRLHVIEYSDLPEDVAGRRDADGGLRLWAGSIGVHVMDVDFLRQQAAAGDALRFHVAHKKVPYLNEQGELIEPQEPNALKFERFIFNLLPAAENAVVVEVDRRRGFAPLKNAPGAEGDTPEDVRAAMVAEDRRRLAEVGVEVAPEVDVEISPLYALDEAEVREKVPPGTRVTQPQLFR